MGGFTGLRTFRTFGDHSPTNLGEAIYGVDMSAYEWAYMPSGGTDILKSDVRVQAKRTIGMVLYDGVTGDEAVVAFGGEITIETGGLIPGQVYYADPTVIGGMTVTQPVGSFQIVGIAITEWRFLISIQSYFSAEDALPYYNSDQEAFDAGFVIYKSDIAHESLPYGVKKEVDPRIISP